MMTHAAIEVTYK